MAKNLIISATPINVRPPATYFIIHDLKMSQDERRGTVVLAEAKEDGSVVLGGIRLSASVSGDTFDEALALLNAPSELSFTERIVMLFIAQRILAQGTTVELLP